MINDMKEILITKEELERKVAEIGEAISKDYADKDLMMVSVLKGSIIFMADLMRAISVPTTIDFMSVSSYGSGSKSSGVVKINKDLDVSVEGKDLLLVEDILDSGNTLNYLINMLKERNPKSVRIATLLDKPERRTVNLKADYIGFTVPDEFVVGYGLDYAEKYRNFPQVAVLKPTIYEENE